MRFKSLAVFVALTGLLQAQDAQVSSGEILQKILERMNALEEQNKQLTQEVRALRQEVADMKGTGTATSASSAQTPAPSVDERVAVNETRVNEQAQTKVEASQRFPVSLTGMLLFNSFLQTGPTASGQSPGYPEAAGVSASGATFRQSMIGLRFQGPQLPGDGSIYGDLMMDFYSGPARPGDNWFRLRRAMLNFNWNSRAFSVGQDKPLIAPYEPSSLAEVGVPALAGAGNLWLWLPQARYEERVRLGNTWGLTPQVAVLQTDEQYATVPHSDNYTYSLEPGRPALEGRLAVWHKWEDTKRIELAAGFHTSASHVAGTSVPSRIFSVDWFAKPWSKLEISGTYLHGRNFASLGGLPQGYRIFDEGYAAPVHSNAGWLQFSSPITSRITVNVFGGFQSNRPSDLVFDDFRRNISYAGNVMYHLGPNVIVSLEALQARARLMSDGDQIRNRYDLAVAYLF